MSNRGMRSIVGFALVALVFTAQAAVPTGAFIRRPVSSVADLINHAKTDKIVMNRFERHFRMSPDRLMSYFSTLHTAKLAKEGVYLVYNVHADNVIRGRYFKMPKGTLVFADGSGRPILKKGCGNPMTMTLPTIVAEAPTTQPVGPKGAVLGDVSTSEELVAMEPGVGAVPAPVAPPVAPPVRAQVAGGFIGGGGAGFGFLPILLGLGSAGFLIKKEDCDTPPVPEPATMLVLAAGAAGVAIKRRKRSS